MNLDLEFSPNCKQRESVFAALPPCPLYSLELDEFSFFLSYESVAFSCFVLVCVLVVFWIGLVFCFLYYSGKAGCGELLCWLWVWAMLVWVFVVEC